MATPMMQIAMDLAVLTGLRRGDLLDLKRENLTDQGILVRTAKTSKALLIEWSDDLLNVIGRAKRMRPQVRQHLIANKQGKPYTSSGFASIWQKTMYRALQETSLIERFRFNDLRAKSASDDSLEAATQRLGHNDVQTTQRFYRRKPSKVKPLLR